MESPLSFALSLTVIGILLLGLFALTTLNSVFRRLQKKDLKKSLTEVGKLFFYRPLHVLFFPQHENESLFLANTFTQNIVRFFYAIMSLSILLHTGLISFDLSHSSLDILFPNGIIALVLLFLLFFIVGDYIPRIFGVRYPQTAFKLCAIPASIFMLLAFPFTFLFLKLSHFFSHTLHFAHLAGNNAEAKQEIIDIIQESDVETQLDSHDKQLFESVMGFRDRIAREVMVPRVDVFSFPHDMTIKAAADQLIKEGYSRTPVYNESLDDIIGVLMYKDILAKYMEYASKGNDECILNAPISTLVKNVIYTPETKKISQLLQEFRKKQVHLAIIVDEYGGTEGIVTIEDILEEIVGDIEDEYDNEETLFIPLPHGGWLVDARMGILDIEEQLGIEIPPEGDYDTIGGYIFHETGMIPSKGFIITQPNFEIEVLRSNDRRVEKVRINPINAASEQEDTLSEEETD